MEILNTFTDQDKQGETRVFSAHWSTEDGTLTIAESGIGDRTEIRLDALSSWALRDYLNARAKATDE